MSPRESPTGRDRDRSEPQSRLPECSRAVGAWRHGESLPLATSGARPSTSRGSDHRPFGAAGGGGGGRGEEGVGGGHREGRGQRRGGAGTPNLESPWSLPGPAPRSPLSPRKALGPLGRSAAPRGRSAGLQPALPGPPPRPGLGSPAQARTASARVRTAATGNWARRGSHSQAAAPRGPRPSSSKGVTHILAVAAGECRRRSWTGGRDLGGAVADDVTGRDRMGGRGAQPSVGVSEGRSRMGGGARRSQWACRRGGAR